MLIGISPLISPDLLVTLYRMGHGDEIVLADAHFPGESLWKTRIASRWHKDSRYVGCYPASYCFGYLC